MGYQSGIIVPEHGTLPGSISSSRVEDTARFTYVATGIITDRAHYFGHPSESSLVDGATGRKDRVHHRLVARDKSSMRGGIG